MPQLKYLMLTASLLLIACGEEKGKSDATSAQAHSTSNCTLIFGWESRKPYQFFENKQMQGIDVEILQKAAKAVDCDLAFVEKSWGELIEQIESGKIDVLAGATPTTERKRYAEFSSAYRAEEFKLFVPAESSFSGESLRDFLSLGNKVGVAEGYFYGDDVATLRQHKQYTNLFRDTKSNEQNFFSVEYGRVDGILIDPVEGRYIIKRRGLGDKMKESGVTINADEVAYMFSKKSQKIKKIAIIKNELDKMLAANEPQKIMAKYQ